MTLRSVAGEDTAFGHEICIAGASDDPAGHVSRVLARAFDGLASSYSFVRTRDHDNALAEPGSAARRWDPALFARSCGHRRFGATLVTDRFANRAVNTAELYAGERRALDAFRREVTAPLGVWWQLRVSLYADRDLVGHVAICRSRHRGEYEPADAQRLTELVPALKDAFSARASIAASELGRSGILCALDEWLEPVYVVAGSGAVAWANAAARTTRPPCWIHHVHDRALVPADVRLRPLESGGARYWIVIGPGPPAVSLPPRLARVAEQMVRGLADKDIASATGLSVASVRTYVTAIYRRTGARNRVVLAKMLAGHAPARERDGGGTQ